jgi:acetyl-CoA C-acetyltransferase
LPIDPRTPVLVGAGVASRREEDPARALEPSALMQEALARAGDDAGAPALLRDADLIAVPRGFWTYPDPGRLVAHGLGAAKAKTLLCEIGVLQTTLFAEAARAIAQGADVVLVTGGEARHRAARARAAGAPEGLSAQPPGCAPDRVLRPDAEIVHPIEIARRFVVPVAQYALLENALRREAGLSVEAQRRELAAFWAGFGRVAAANPQAWNREPPDAEALADSDGRNPLLAFPYGRHHCSQWTVDQAAGLIFCSAERARRAGIPERRFVFPRAVAESNHMRSLVTRATLARSPGFGLAWRRALELSGLAPEELSLRELYSCFPSAVRIQLRELGLSPEPVPTVTGGMAFAGGPLNNFVLQALARIAELLRERGGAALLTAVSGMLTKQGVSLWSCEPGAGFGHADVSREAEGAEAPRTLADAGEGEGTIAGYTVVREPKAPLRTVAIVDLDTGLRTLADSDDPDLAGEAMWRELAGLRVRVLAGGRLVAG